MKERSKRMGGPWWPPLLLLALFVACTKPPAQPPLAGTWFANAQSINYLNLQRMALDLRADSTYRYYFRNAPAERDTTGEEYTEGGRFRVRNDSLLFTVAEANGNKTTFDYARKFRLLSDTTEWPLRVTYVRRSVEFEVYFQRQ